MNNKITSIITGDIVNSRKTSPNIWLESIKTVLKNNNIDQKNWEIYRGDKFQIELDPKDVLRIAILLKASIKREKNQDVRMAIGIGNKSYTGNKILESNGEAYINSGHCFDNLKKKKLAIKSPWDKFDAQWNLYLRLASLTMDDWAPMTANIVSEALTNSNSTQSQIAKKLNRTQGRISEGLQRAGYDEILLTLEYFKKEKALKRNNK